MALAGTPGLESTCSFSRNGFAQVTAVFTDRTDIYFARQQVTERLTDAKDDLPPGVEVKMGPISTGLGEVYWWAVEYAPPGSGPRSRWRARLAERRHLSDARGRAPGRRVAAHRLSAHRAGLDHPAADEDRARRRRRGCHRRLCQAVSGPTRSREARRLRPVVRQVASAIEANNVSRGANYIERNGEGYVVRASGRIEYLAEIGDIVVATHRGVPVRIRDVARDHARARPAHRQRQHERARGRARYRAHAGGGNSRTVSAAADAKINEINRALPPGIRAKDGPEPHAARRRHHSHRGDQPAEGALLVVLVLFLLLGNFRAAFITALVIPVTMMITAFGMLQLRLSANLMSLGALDFGLIVDGAVIIAENSLRHLADRQRAAGRMLCRASASTPSRHRRGNDPADRVTAKPSSLWSMFRCSPFRASKARRSSRWR